MTNPPYILEHLPEIAKILNHPRVYAFLHIPVQSASDRVLVSFQIFLLSLLSLFFSFSLLFSFFVSISLLPNYDGFIF